MNGTSLSHTLAMDLMPPKITMATRIPITTPTTHGGHLKFSFATVAIALTWVAQPIPKDATPPNRANRKPSHFIFRPLSRAYIAPPCMRPSLVFTRYLTAIRDSAYFVAIPNTPVSQHHRTAPGPPSAIAVPTPIMFPVPIVAASAVVSAPKDETSPSASGSFDTESLIPLLRVFLCMKPVRIVMKMCVPRSRMIIHQPQTKLSRLLIKFTTASIILIPPPKQHFRIF